MHNLNRFLSQFEDVSKNTKGPNKSKSSGSNSVNPSSRLNGGVNFVLADIDTATSLVRSLHQPTLRSYVSAYVHTLTLIRIPSLISTCSTWDSLLLYRRVSQTNLIIGSNASDMIQHFLQHCHPSSHYPFYYLSVHPTCLVSYRPPRRVIHEYGYKVEFVDQVLCSMHGKTVLSIF